MLVGLPGSGKSTYAERLKEEGYEVFSSDSIREELTGDASTQTENTKVFQILHKRIKEALRAGKNAVYDATNTSWKRRTAFIGELTSIPCIKKAYVIATPYEVCLEWNASRERKVPEYAIERMYKSFTIPYYQEGWDYIEVCYPNERFASCYGSYSQFLFDTITYDQCNSHHKLSLGSHCEGALNYIRDNFKSTKNNFFEVKLAAALHDCGKPFVQEFMDSSRRPSDDAHYYGHEYVGCYNCLFYEHESIDILLVSALICWHMLPYNMEHFLPETKEKYIKRFTATDELKEDFWDNLLILHEADVYAH